MGPNTGEGPPGVDLSVRVTGAQRGRAGAQGQMEQVPEGPGLGRPVLRWVAQVPHRESGFPEPRSLLSHPSRAGWFGGG